ncbi:unnamed protein product, partial [Didymodactylos carnosus]
SGQKTSRFKKYRRSVPHGYPSSLLSDAIRRSYDNASSVTTNQAAQPQLLAPLTLVSTYNPNNLDLFPFIRSLLPQTRGFQNRYENDLDFAHGIHKIIALCFIHPDNIIDGFGRLSIGLYPSFQEILDYFEDTYIGRLRSNGSRARPLFPIDFWNVHDRTKASLMKTNN